MRNIVYSLAVAALLLLIFVQPSLSAQGHRPITRLALESIVQNVDWVFQGLVTNVQARRIASMEVYGNGSREPDMVITEITMGQLQILAGEYEGNEITIALPEGKLGDLRTIAADYSPMDVKIGDWAIVGIRANRYGTPYHMLDDRRAFFKLAGDHLAPFQREYYLAVEKPIEIMKQQAKKREMPEVFKAADLVCLATVTKPIAPNSPAKEIEVRIDEILKGAPEKRTIAIDVSGIYRSFKQQRPGDQALLFLKKEVSSYKPIDGVNGYYLIVGNRLYRGFTLPLHSGVDELKSMMKTWKEVEQ